MIVISNNIIIATARPRLAKQNSLCVTRLPQLIRKVPRNTMAPFIAASLTTKVWPPSVLLILKCRSIETMSKKPH